MFKWLQRKFINDLIEVVREMWNKILNNSKTPRSRRIDNHFPTKYDIEEQMEKMRESKESKAKKEKETAHRILRGGR